MAIFNSFLYVYQIPGAMGRFDAPHWMEGSQASSCPPCQSIARTEELSWTPGVWRKCRGNMEEIWRKYAGIKSWLIPLSNLNFLPHFVKPLAWLDLRSVSETLNDVRDIEGTINMALILNLYRLSLVTQASAKLGHILRLFSLFKSCFLRQPSFQWNWLAFLDPHLHKRLCEVVKTWDVQWCTQTLFRQSAFCFLTKGAVLIAKFK